MNDIALLLDPTERERVVAELTQEAKRPVSEYRWPINLARVVEEMRPVRVPVAKAQPKPTPRPSAASKRSLNQLFSRPRRAPEKPQERLAPFVPILRPLPSTMPYESARRHSTAQTAEAS